MVKVTSDKGSGNGEQDLMEKFVRPAVLELIKENKNKNYPCNPPP